MRHSSSVQPCACRRAPIDQGGHANTAELAVPRVATKTAAGTAVRATAATAVTATAAKSRAAAGVSARATGRILPRLRYWAPRGAHGAGSGQTATSETATAAEPSTRRFVAARLNLARVRPDADRASSVGTSRFIADEPEPQPRTGLASASAPRVRSRTQLKVIPLARYAGALPNQIRRQSAPILTYGFPSRR
jgi:hypothetical protein